MYTGVRNVRRRNGKLESFQTQCIAIGNGIDYEKIALNPVIDASMLPEGGSTHDFRDPKIWEEDGHYYAVVGNRSEDDSGTILLFESADALHWQYVSVLAACHNQYGKMWECPDFFHLDGCDVLLTSPQEMTAIGLEFHPGNANICLIGHLDREKHHLVRERVQAIDYGLDFYAPQTLKTPDGRRIMIAWMQNWETSSCAQNDLSFFGQMTLPRELTVRNGRLCQVPVREIEKYRGVKIDYRNVLITGETSLRGIHGRCLDMSMVPAICGERRRTLYHDPVQARNGNHKGGPYPQWLPA